RTTMTMGEAATMQLIAERLIVGERMGTVPEDAPIVPLAADLAMQQKSLRLKPEAVERLLDLDLRKEIDLGRSRLIHRLRLLSVNRGEPRGGAGGSRGTFHEIWMLQWQPELVIAVIEAAVWGTT